MRGRSGSAAPASRRAGQGGELVVMPTVLDDSGLSEGACRQVDATLIGEVVSVRDVSRRPTALNSGR